MIRIIALSFFLLLFSCSDDSGTGPDNGDNALGSFRVDIDDTRWDATQGFVFSSLSAGDSFSLLSVSASKSISITESQASALSVSAPVSNLSGLEGTYALDGSAAAALSFVTTASENVVSYLSYSGQIIITKVTASNVKGTFNAMYVNTSDPEDTIMMSNGSFNASIINP